MMPVLQLCTVSVVIWGICSKEEILRKWVGVVAERGPVWGCSYAIKKKDEIERVAKANR